VQHADSGANGDGGDGRTYFEVARLWSTVPRAGALSLPNSMAFLGRGAGPVLFAGLAVGFGSRAVFAAAGVGLLVAGVAAVAPTTGARLDEHHVAGSER
jgi:hypothetical protein